MLEFIRLLCLFLNNEIIYFDNFGVEYVQKEIKKFIGHKNIKSNVFRKSTNNLIMCRYFCTGIIDFMLADKTLNLLKN